MPRVDITESVACLRGAVKGCSVYKLGLILSRSLLENTNFGDIAITGAFKLIYTREMIFDNSL